MNFRGRDSVTVDVFMPEMVQGKSRDETVTSESLTLLSRANQRNHATSRPHAQMLPSLGQFLMPFAARATRLLSC